MARLRKWLADERDFVAAHTHFDLAKREIADYIARGWEPSSVMDLDSYSGHKFAGVRIKSHRVTVEIPGRGEMGFSLPRLLSLVEKEKYQQPLFS